ncbi:HTH tetR-type domain-containing protein [Stackebrandtia soli]
MTERTERVTCRGPSSIKLRAHIAWIRSACHDHVVPRVSPEQLNSRRREILAGARACFARYGYEGATVRRLEEEIGLSRGAIFHHFKDKDSLFLSVAEDDAIQMAETVAQHGLVQVMRNLSAEADSPETTGWLGSQLEVSRRLRTDDGFARAWEDRKHAIAQATRERLQRQLDAGILRTDLPIEVLAGFLELAYDGLITHLAMGSTSTDMTPILDLVEAAVRRRP